MGCVEIEGILFSWDDEKERLNIEKHNVDFQTASLVYFDDHRLELIDFEHSDDGEQRYNVIGMAIDEVLFVVDIETYRDNTVLIISAREATKKEVDLYEQGLYKP
jgi:uncharacterized DUF497 family protein